MTADHAAQQLLSQVVITQPDVARAKTFVMQTELTTVDSIVDQWLHEQNVPKRDVVNTDAADCPDALAVIARHFSLRMAMYQAIWELVSACELLPASPPNTWSSNVTNRTSHYSGALLQKPVTFVRLTEVHKPPPVAAMTTDPDIFLQGVNCATLHDGIREGVAQALMCFRRGLYMPAVVMLAAAAEATWTECGLAVARHVGHATLGTHVADQRIGVSRKIVEIRRALESAPDLLKSAGQTMPKVAEAEQWTTILRDRRNALHWGKAKSFIVEHGDTASLMLGGPLHLQTLEAIRAAC